MAIRRSGSRCAAAIKAFGWCAALSSAALAGAHAGDGATQPTPQHPYRPPAMHEPQTLPSDITAARLVESDSTPAYSQEPSACADSTTAYSLQPSACFNSLQPTACAWQSADGMSTLSALATAVRERRSDKPRVIAPSRAFLPPAGAAASFACDSGAQPSIPQSVAAASEPAYVAPQQAVPAYVVPQQAMPAYSPPPSHQVAAPRLPLAVPPVQTPLAAAAAARTAHAAAEPAQTPPLAAAAAAQPLSAAAAAHAPPSAAAEPRPTPPLSNAAAAEPRHAPPSEFAIRQVVNIERTPSAGHTAASNPLRMTLNAPAELDVSIVREANPLR